MVWLLAHQGGWDEFLMFAIPVALGWWAIRAAERRSRARAAEIDAADDVANQESSNES